MEPGSIARNSRLNRPEHSPQICAQLQPARERHVGLYPHYERGRHLSLPNAGQADASNVHSADGVVWWHACEGVQRCGHANSLSAVKLSGGFLSSSLCIPTFPPCQKFTPVPTTLGVRVYLQHSSVEADNLFVMFPSPHLAVLASMHCQASTRKHNKERRKNDQLHLSMSVVHGDMFLIPGACCAESVLSSCYTLGNVRTGAYAVPGQARLRQPFPLAARFRCSDCSHAARVC
eukprot:1037927-Pleurochrysis_carterae.AAC.1